MEISLRYTTEDDLDFVLKAERAFENSPFVFLWTRAQHTAILSSEGTAHFVVEQASERTKVGYLIIDGLADPNQSVELKRLVITEKNRGYGRATLRLVKRLAFSEWGAHRLWLDVKEQNFRARHLYESEGFVVEGVMRESYKTEAGFESLVLMSMLRSEYENGAVGRCNYASTPDLKSNRKVFE